MAAKHPAMDLPLAERVDYLTIVASVCGADGAVNSAEVEELLKLCRLLEIGASDIAVVVAAAERPEEAEVQARAARLRTSPLRFTLLTDLLFLAYADGSPVEAEEAELAALADALGVTDDQLAAIRKYVVAVLQARTATGVDAADYKKLGGDLAASLASVGVPVAAVAVSGSVFGLSAAGITSGLAALGMGLGMATGLGVAIGIGVGSYFGVRWLFRKVVGA